MGCQCTVGRMLNDSCEDLEDLADQIGIERFSIIGISGGAPYALACVYNLPARVRKVAIVCRVGPLHFLGQEDFCLYSEEKICLQGLEFTRTYMPQLAKMVHADPDPDTAYYIANLSEVDRKIMTEDIIPIFKQSAIKAVRQVEGMVDDYVIFGHRWNIPIQKSHVPVELWHSEADQIVPIRHADYLASTIPNAKLHRRQKYDHTGTMLVVQPDNDQFLTFQ